MRNNTTVVAVFDNHADAERAANDLATIGIEREDIEITCNAPTRTAVTSTAEGGAASTHDEGFGERVSNFFRRLFGGESEREDTAYYAAAVARGSAVVTVKARTEADADRAADILHDRGAIDVDERAKEWRQSGWAGSPAGSTAFPGDAKATALARDREQVIPVVQEELQVGKRRRDRGGVRIYTHTSEQPVEEEVHLREEHARVERRPADRPATDADLSAFKEGTIEVRETIEEPVVAKKARVVEEVVVAKETSDRVESVNDVVRKGEVEVERLEGDRSRYNRQPATSAYDEYDADYRAHWDANYRQTGGAYEDYQPAYRYGSTLASNERYRGRDWSEIEADARRDWETRYPGNAWDRFKTAIRHGWDRLSASSKTTRRTR